MNNARRPFATQVITLRMWNAVACCWIHAAEDLATGVHHGVGKVLDSHPDLSAIGLGSIGHVVCDRVVAEGLLAFLTVIYDATSAVVFSGEIAKVASGGVGAPWGTGAGGVPVWVSRVVRHHHDMSCTGYCVGEGGDHHH